MVRTTRLLTQSVGHKTVVARLRAPAYPEYRRERPVLPYVGPVTSEEWRLAWAEAIENDPDTREMLGV